MSLLALRQQFVFWLPPFHIAWFVMWTFFCLSNNLQLEYSKSIIYAARLTLNYAVLLPWKPLTTYYCLVWQINNASFSLMSAISKALLCQTKGPFVQCLVSNHGKWQTTRENCWNGPRIYQYCYKLKPSSFLSLGSKIFNSKVFNICIIFFLCIVPFWTYVIIQNGNIG